MKKMALILALAALVCWLPGQALASLTLTIYDNANGTVTGGWGSSFTSPVFTTGTETASGSAYDGDLFAFNTNEKVNLIFKDADGSASDFLTISTGSSSHTLNFTFESDGAAGFASAVAALTNPVYVTETGALQDVSSSFNCIFNWDSVCIQVQSCEPSAVPIPPSVLLLGSGLLGLVGIGWRKRG